jgi:hypothetical protein
MPLHSWTAPHESRRCRLMCSVGACQRQCPISLCPRSRRCSRYPTVSVVYACYRHISSSMAQEEPSYSIWLMPDPTEDFHKRVAAEIEYWAPKKNGPLFSPHVTLIGGIRGTKDDVLNKTEALSKQLRVPSLPLGSSWNSFDL